MRPMTSSQIILITGSNSGFGRLMFASMRDITARNAQAAEELRGQVQAGTLGAMGLGGLLQLATRSQAS